MNRESARTENGIARALIAFLALSVALGLPLDAAAHAASQEVAAGNTSALVKVVAAFDVIDDAFDHQSGDGFSRQDQIVVQFAMPEPELCSIQATLVTRVEHATFRSDRIFSRTPPPLDRPPRA